jgi:hypothetical protein
MRPVALGRRNWIHIGSVQAGPKIAAILSVVDSCVDRNSQLRDYLKHKPSAAFSHFARGRGRPLTQVKIGAQGGSHP